MGPGLRPAALITLAIFTRRRCSRTARFLSQEDIRAGPPLRPQNCTIRRMGLGRLPEASASRAILIRRLCCPMGRCLSQEETTEALLRARNYMIRQAEPGPRLAIS